MTVQELIRRAAVTAEVLAEDGELGLAPDEAAELREAARSLAELEAYQPGIGWDPCSTWTVADAGTAERIAYDLRCGEWAASVASWLRYVAAWCAALGLPEQAEVLDAGGDWITTGAAVSHQVLVDLGDSLVPDPATTPWWVWVLGAALVLR